MLRFLFLVVLTAAIAVSDGAFGQTFCAYREDILNRLATEWDEELVEVEDFGLYGLMEVLRSPANGTWTVIITKPNGTSCVLATGRGLSTDKDFLAPTEYML